MEPRSQILAQNPVPFSYENRYGLYDIIGMHQHRLVQPLRNRTTISSSWHPYQCQYHAKKEQCWSHLRISAIFEAMSRTNNMHSMFAGSKYVKAQRDTKEDDPVGKITKDPLL